MTSAFDGLGEAIAATATLEREDVCYPHGRMVRRATVLLVANRHNPIALPYGRMIHVRAGIADSFFTVPARWRYRGATVRGFLSESEVGDVRVLTFTPEAGPGAHDQYDACANQGRA